MSIGSPFGLEQSVATGIVSATSRSQVVSSQTDGSNKIYPNLIQTDAAINNGNSGGCMLNARGEVIGISEAKLVDSSVEGMCYAIPISTNSELIQNLLNGNSEVAVADEDAQGGYLGIQGKDVEIVKLLLKYGANPNLQEINGRNAFHEAAEIGDIKIITLIREAGVNPLSRDKQGNTPFSIVLKKDIKVINAIFGKSTTITDSDGNSPIHIIVKNNGSNSLLENLIKAGYPIDTRNSDGYTPLNYAIEADNVSTALILLQNGANPFQTIDKKGNNGVTIALEKNNAQMISNIVKYANGMTDIQGNTILHYAAKTSSAQTIKTLISYGIDKNVKNVSGDTPYTIAMRWKRPDIAELLSSVEGNEK